MARIKGGLNARKKHNRVLKLAKGYRGARSKQYRVAKQSVMRALTSSYAGRKERKRQFRQLWIARINAAARLNGLSYSQFMHGLKLAEVDLNRKVLADMAVTDPAGFASLVEVAKAKSLKSGITLKVSTNLPGFQFYTANNLGKPTQPKNKNGNCYEKHSGVCVEPQFYPNAINTNSFIEKGILKVGNEYKKEIKLTRAIS